MKRKILMRKVTAAVLAAAMVVIGAPAAAAPAFADEASSAIVPLASFSGMTLADGTYEGSGTGYKGATTVVSVTVSGGMVTAIEITSHGDTKAFMNIAKDDMIKAIIDSQSTDVDVVTGATSTSHGIISAVEDALGIGETGNQTYEAGTWQEFQAALDDSTDGDTIKLTADITDGGYNSSRSVDTLSEEALDAISAATEADTTEEAVEAVNATANVFNNITIDGDGHSITPYTDESGAVKQCAFYVVADNATIKNVELNGLNFKNYVGGAMYMQTEATDLTTELTLDTVAFINCSGNKANARNSGGAVYAESHVSDGSGIDANGTPKLNIKNCVFQDCTIKSKTGLGRGGAVAGLQADITIEDSFFAGNTGMYGGAVCVFGENSTLTVKNSYFTEANDATYGGDDIYIFDGYTWQKNKEQRDSSTNATLSGNVYEGVDGEDFTAYRVMRASVLGTVDDTVNAIKSYNYGADYEYKGTGSELAGGHNAVFDTADTNRTAAPVSDSLIKSDNGLTVTGNTVKVKFAKLKKKAQTIAAGKALTMEGAQGTVAYQLKGVKKAKFKKYFKVNAKTGKVTVKKGLKKGTYKITVNVTASGDAYANEAAKTVVFKVKVK